MYTTERKQTLTAIFTRKPREHSGLSGAKCILRPGQTIAICFLLLFGSLLSCANSDDELTAGETIGILAFATTYPAATRDQDMVFSLLSHTANIYAANVTVSGAQNAAGDCAQGGTFTLTGTVTSSGGNATLDLNYNFAGCRITHTSSGIGLTTSLALTGSVTEVGLLTASLNTSTYTSQSLRFAGDLTRPGFNTLSMDDTCDISANRTANGATAGLCSRLVSY